MNREVREYRNELRKNASRIRVESAKNDKEFERIKKLREQESEMYEKYRFLDSLIKANEKMESKGRRK